MKRNLTYIEAFLEMLVAERSVAKNTYISYKNDLFDLYAFAQDKDFLEFSRVDLENFVISLSRRSLSAKSLARKVSVIRQFYGFFISEDYIKENPALNLELPRLPRSVPKALYLQQLEKLFVVASQDKTPHGLRMLAILELLYATGLRISELIVFKLSALREASEAISEECAVGSALTTLVVKGKGGKERLVIINENAMQAISEYLRVRDWFVKGDDLGYLFPSNTKSGKPCFLSRQRCFQMLKKLAIDAGLPPEIVSPHKIRHSFATHLLARGANLREVQELLGHADISSTQIYTKVANDKAIELVMKHHPIRQC